MENLPDRVLLLEEGAKGTVKELVEVANQFKEIIRSIRDETNRWEKAKNGFILVYVSKEEFRPVKNIVYGMVGAILLAFLTAVGALILRK